MGQGLQAACPPDCLVNLKLTPATQSVCSVGGTVDVAIRAISADGAPHSMAAIASCLRWDPVYLRLQGIYDDAESPYTWLANFFPDDRTQDRLNDDRANNVFWSEQVCVNDLACSPLVGCDLFVGCSNDGDCRPETFCNMGLTCGPQHCCNTSYCFFTGLPFNDGNAYHEAWSALFSPPGPAIATAGPNGLLLTKFRFQTLAATPPGGTTVFIDPFCGATPTLTAVYDGETPNSNILNVISNPPATVHVGTLGTPTASAEGCRYIRVTPGPGTVQIALKVKGISPGETCVDHFVQNDGSLGTSAVFKTGTNWGTVYVRDERIVPDGIYEVRADCGTSTSSPITVHTFIWGDVDDNHLIDLDDILWVLDAFIGFYNPPATFERCNLMHCVENPPGLPEVIDLDDILGILDAFIGFGYDLNCGSPCP